MGTGWRWVCQSSHATLSNSPALTLSQHQHRAHAVTPTPVETPTREDNCTPTPPKVMQRASGGSWHCRGNRAGSAGGFASPCTSTHAQCLLCTARPPGTPQADRAQGCSTSHVNKSLMPSCDCGQGLCRGQAALPDGCAHAAWALLLPVRQGRGKQPVNASASMGTMSIPCRGSWVRKSIAPGEMEPCFNKHPRRARGVPALCRRTPTVFDRDFPHACLFSTQSISPVLGRTFSPPNQTLAAGSDFFCKVESSLLFGMQ